MLQMLRNCYENVRMLKMLTFSTFFNIVLIFFNMFSNIFQHFLIIFLDRGFVDRGIRVRYVGVPQTLLWVLPALFICWLDWVAVGAGNFVVLVRWYNHLGYILWRLLLIIRLMRWWLYLHVLEVLITDGHDSEVSFYVSRDHFLNWLHCGDVLMSWVWSFLYLEVLVPRHGCRVVTVANVWDSRAALQR